MIIWSSHRFEAPGRPSIIEYYALAEVEMDNVLWRADLPDSR